MRKILFLYLLLSSGCSSFFFVKHDPQFVQIDFRYGNKESLNTFSGIIVKDLIPGSASTDFWFTTKEQEAILTKVDSLGFYDLPDTINFTPNIRGDHDFGPEYLRIKYGNKDKTVIVYQCWLEKMPEIFIRVRRLENFIMDLSRSKSEYKSLPPAKGLYL